MMAATPMAIPSIVSRVRPLRRNRFLKIMTWLQGPVIRPFPPISCLFLETGAGLPAGPLSTGKRIQILPLPETIFCPRCEKRHIFKSSSSADPMRSSAQFLPSHITTTRWVWRATEISWVTTRKVVPWDWLIWCSRSINSPPAVVSRDPVGSSASTRGGLFANARATAARWRCPPESWLGR